MAPHRVMMSSLAIVIMSAAVLFADRAAGAHAELVASCPGEGDVMAVVDRIEIGFSGPLQETVDRPIVIIVEDADGNRVELGSIAPTSVRAIAANASLTTPGSYVVSYEAPAFDGDLTTGSFRFRIDPEFGRPADCADAAAAVDDSGSSWVLVGAIIATIGVLGAVAFAGRSIWSDRTSDS